MEGRAPFEERIKAWSHGPVVPSVYHEYKAFGGSVLPPPDADDFSWDEIDEPTTEFLMGVWKAYGGFSATRLRNMTHAELPWQAAFAWPGDSVEIELSDMIRQFAGSVTE